MARFTLPRDLYHGKGALEELKHFEGKKAVVCVGGGSMKRFGFLDRCTPLGVMKIFDAIDYDLDGKNVLVCGQSDIVGRPLVDMLIKRHCNVISVNSSGSFMKCTALAMDMVDVIISAVGKRNFITSFGIDRVEVCIDVGINYDENGKQHGDCADAVYNMENIKVTPRIGGVGLMTRAMLLYNVWRQI